MTETTAANATKTVLPAAQAVKTVQVAQQPAQLGMMNTKIKLPPIVLPQQFAPAWFYSALAWLGKSYVDASGAVQSFSTYVAGSDVDPYKQLGATRLFLIEYTGDSYNLTMALDANSNASLSGGTSYPNTDQGITQMYVALSSSPIFPSVNFCYVPGRLFSDREQSAFVAERASLSTGYDPATGLRAIVFGSAVAQAVPLDDFMKTHNEQVYDDAPDIVPVVSSLVYDVTQNNQLGAKTFTLPTFYARDQVSAGNYYANDAGDQSVTFPGGPGYNAANATSLALNSTSTSSAQGQSLTTYTFETATVVTSSTLGSTGSVQLGTSSLTYDSGSPASAFANQTIIGFYRDDSWTDSLGVPIYDYGSSNSSFTSTASSLSAPTTIYNPTTPFLNGGTLQNVVEKLTSATYFYSSDELVDILDTAIAAKGTKSGAGLSVTTAALAFDMSSAPSTPIVGQLSVPVIATVTTTPPSIYVAPTLNAVTNEVVDEAANADLATGAAADPTTSSAAAPAPAAKMAPAAALKTTTTAIGTITTTVQPISIGQSANNPPQTQAAPSTVQVGLEAFVPQQALSGTGISSLETGTQFPQQPLGEGSTFEESPGVTVNLMDTHSDTPSYAPYVLTLATAGFAFASGVSYVLSASGTNLSIAGSDGSSATSSLPSPGADANHTFVGSMVYSSSLTTVELYPMLQLSLAAPAVGTNAVTQGAQYSVRFTFGTPNSQYDVIDSTQSVVASGVTVASPTPTDGSNPQPGDLYFGSFLGGASQMTVWSVPVFLTVTPSQLTGASFNGSMTLGASSSGLPSYQLQITDSSLFVYSNINVDTYSIGSVSASNVYLASAVINSSPDAISPQAFAPSKLVMGLIRQVQMGTVLKYVFVPEDDSVVIGGTRYMLSVINLDELDDDPNSRPYPPVYWPQTRYWQFANRHNPYLGVRYTGATEADRITQAQTDIASIGLEMSQAQEPMQMYLDTNQQLMTVWPIYPFPYATASQSVDQGQLQVITNTILQILGTTFPAQPAPASGSLANEQINLPSALQQNNPYTAGSATVSNPNPSSTSAVTSSVANTSLSGAIVTDLSQGAPQTRPSDADLSVQRSFDALKSQQAAATTSAGKSSTPMISVTQEHVVTAKATSAATTFAFQFQPIFGFSVYNPGTGEAYIVEIVDSDLQVPDQLPDPTVNQTYDPYYVRVVFLNTLTCYNMSIMVPSMVRDQYRYLAHQGTSYQNVLSKTNELEIGYMYSLYDSSNNFDNLDFTPYPATPQSVSESESYIYTNLPYTAQQTALFNPSSLFGNLSLSFLTVKGASPASAAEASMAEKALPSINLSGISFIEPSTPPIYFVCRRLNWDADCHLMQATNPSGTSVYLAFGGGDIVPFRLDGGTPDVDKRLPAHMYELTQTFADQQYEDAQTISVANTPYVIAVANNYGIPTYTNFSIKATSGTSGIRTTGNLTLSFPTDIYIVGEQSATQTNVSDINAALGTNYGDTGAFVNQDSNGNVIAQEYQVLTYNNLVYLVRAISNFPALGQVGGLGTVSGLLIDTYVPATSGNLQLAQGARYQRSGMQYFGQSYTQTTMQDSLDTLNFTSITGNTFYAPTIFIPIPELDSSKGFVANLSNFIGQQIWTFIYPEIVAQPDTTVNGVSYPQGYNLDGYGKPVLSLQKLHFVYDPIAVMFTPNDLAHKYALQPKQQILALTNGQVEEGICWRTANVQPQRLPPRNILAQQIPTQGIEMDATNIIYDPHNRPVITATDPTYMGMSVNSFISVSGVVYNIEEGALSQSTDQTGTGLISQVASVSNMLVSVLFDYDNNDQGSLTTYDETESTKGVVFLNGYLSSSGYSFSSADHFDVNDVLPSQVPLLDEVADIFGWDVAFYNMDASLPRQFWSLTYDTFTAPGLPNFIPNVPPSLVDPTFSNRTRSLILSLQNPVRPTELGLVDTYSSVVSASLHLENGVTGSIFLSKKADRNVASIGSNATEQGANPVFGLPTKYDFFIFSRDHYWTLEGASFELVDMGYAMCLVDDGSGTGTKVARYYVDSDGNYYELFTYVLYSPDGGVIESPTPFPLKVILGAPANLSATPIIPETPNNVNPQDLVAQINKVSNLIYAAFGPSSPGQAPAFIPIQAVGGEVQALPIMGQPGFNGYAVNVMAQNNQPVQISQIFSASVAYNIAGTTTIVPVSTKTGKAVPFYGSISHGLDKQVSLDVLYSKDGTSYIPAPTTPQGPTSGLFGGDGLGALVGTAFSWAFEGSGAIPPAIASNPTPGTTMKGDASVFYSFNAVTNNLTDSTGKSGSASGGQYFVDTTDPANPIYGVVSLPKFTFNGNSYAVNISTTLSDGVTPCYTLTVGGQNFPFEPGNTRVTADLTTFTFNPIAGGVYTVTYASVDAPVTNEAPTPIPLTPFTITAGGVALMVDVFNLPGELKDMILGVTGRLYTYDPIHALVTVSAGSTSTVVPLETGITFASNSMYGYVISIDDGVYYLNGAPMYPYNASTTGTPAMYPIMTAPQMFTIGGNFYTFDQQGGTYVSVTGNGQTYPINLYQFSINGEVYIINTNVQPNTVVGGGNTYTMTAGNTQFELKGVQYTILLKQNSLNGATVSGQFNITQGNVVVIEDYVYQLDTLNGQIVGNGTTYPLTTSGFTYTITTADNSFTVTTEPNATTVTIGGVVYLINNTTVVADGITYPILAYRSFADSGNTYYIGLNGTVSVPPPLPLSGTAPYTGSTFTDGTETYTVNEPAAFDGTNYHLVTGGSSTTPAQFTAGSLTYTIRNDGVSIAAGPTKTYIVNTTVGPLSPNSFTFGTETVYFGRTTDVAAFDGTNYFAIANNEFTDSTTSLTYTINGNVAVSGGNSYEIYSNLGQGAYFEVPGGPAYYVNVAVADTGSASGNIYNVFPISGGQFTIPLQYTITVSGSSVTVSAPIYASPMAAPNMTAAGGSLTGGYFTDPVTGITYTCVVDGATITFVDTNNVAYPYPAAGTTDTFVAAVVVATAVNVAVDNESTPNVYPILNNQFIVGTTTYTVNVTVAYQNATTGPYWPIVNGQFIVPSTFPVSNLAYAVTGGNVVKGYVISEDDEFSADGNTVYTVNDVNVVKATNQAKLTGTSPNQTLTLGTLTYTLNSTTDLATLEPTGLDYNTTTDQFTVSYNGLSVTYTVGSSGVTDNRRPSNTFSSSMSGTILTFTDTVTGVTFSFDTSGNNQINVGFPYTNQFFVDLINGITYYVNPSTKKVIALSYVPETTQYGFIAANGTTYLINYNDVGVVFPVISGANVTAGVATVGADTFSVYINQVEPSSGAAGIPVNQNSFQINGNLYTITGTPSGSNYSSCQVVGDAITPKNFITANTFVLTDSTITYTLQLDANNLPISVTATYPVRPSRDLIVVNDDVYVVTYYTPSTGSLLGQGQASIGIANSSFTLTNPFDSTKAKFIFDDLNIYDAGSVVGQFSVYQSPTFFIGSSTYTFNTTTLVVTDNDDRPYPLIPNPTMFSINGFNYVIDTNRVPHAIVGNGNASPLSTDVTVQSGSPVPNSTFTLNGLDYAYVEDSSHNLLAVTGTKSYMISQPTFTFKLDSSLLFTIVNTPPTSGNYAGTTVPIGTITAAGPLTLNIYSGTNESGNSPFFTYKNVLYTLVESEGVYEAVQKTYTVYAATPAATQQQLAVFDLAGTTYIVTDGTTAGATTPSGINPGTMWAATSVSATETQFGLVYGFASQPTNVTQGVSMPSDTQVFQFMVTTTSGSSTVNTLYDILYTPGSNANIVKVDVPSDLPTFTQSWPFNFITAYPLTFETGGYNAFTTFVSETSTPSESFAGAYRTPVVSTDSAIDTMLGTQGDFSLEFWHSLALTPASAYHPFTYSASTTTPLVYFVDVDFENGSDIYVQVNDTVMRATTTPPVFSSRWRHFALTYSQPYVMLCQGAGFQVKDGSNYDFNRNFSVAMTFSATDVNTEQGLLYKGTGSPVTSPELSMSYMVGISGGNVTFTITDGTGTVIPFVGPSIQSGQFYQVIIVKQTTTAVNANASCTTETTDPYGVAFDLSELAPAASGGSSATLSAVPTSGSGSVSFTNVKGTGNTPKLNQLLKNISAVSSGQSYTVSISVRTVNDNGTFGNWTTTNTQQSASSDAAMALNNTGSANLLIGSGYDTSSGAAIPLGSSPVSAGNIQNLYLFNGAINPTGVRTYSGTVDIANASEHDLLKNGLVGYWNPVYDPSGVVNNPFDPNASAVTTNMLLAALAPLAGQEYQATSLYINGYEMSLSLVQAGDVPSSMQGYSPGSSLLDFNAGVYRLEEISMWNMCRQQYQIMDDMFGRLIPSNEPSLVLYLSASFQVQAQNAPILPMNKYIDDIAVSNAVASLNLNFLPASIDLVGSPCVGTCGPLITPNLYTPPGVALTVCDTVPSLTTYSVTINSLTQVMAGEVNEAYAYVQNSVLMLYAGKKVGDLVLTWVSQVQGNPQLVGYVEGAPPAPMANLTLKPTYAGATSVTFSMPTSVNLKYVTTSQISCETNWDLSDAVGVKWAMGMDIAPFGFGVCACKAAISVDFNATEDGTIANSDSECDTELTASDSVNESYKYTVKMQGTLAPYTNDQFMSSLNSETIPSSTAGAQPSKTAILPNPNIGGFTTSNPPSPLPKTAPTEEKFGQRMYVPSPYGQAFVISQTLDVYQETLLQTNTVYGYVQVPNSKIPPDYNILSFRMNSQYVRPGSLDGVIGYAYNPATLPTGTQTYNTSTGEMQVAYDGNFSQGQVGSEASYMRVVEAYQMKKQIDQETFNAIANYYTAYQAQCLPDCTGLLPALDFYNEYVWSSRGGTQEVKHNYQTSYQEVYTTSTILNDTQKYILNAKLYGVAITWIDLTATYTTTFKGTFKYAYTSQESTSFCVSASFCGLENDTQMRYASNNDAHFVMLNNSTFNPNNQSGLNLVIGSDGLVYNITSSAESGAGLPTSNNLDNSMTYSQPPPAYASGNASGLTGNLEPYDRPGKTNLFRTYLFFLQPTQQNNTDFWCTVIDPIWKDNSPDPDAVTLRNACQNSSVPWRVLYRVTYSERFLPPISTEPVCVPQIVPVMAVPVTNPATDFLYAAPGTSPAPAHNPANDIEANVVLIAPTASGASIGTVPTTGPDAGQPTVPNNVIPFDLTKTLATPVDWGDTNNVKLIGQLLTSVLGLNTLQMSTQVLPGSTKVTDVMDPVSGGVLYSIYTDPNGLTVNVPTNAAITVYQDANGNPIQYYDGKEFHSLQANYVATTDGTVMYYIEPPSTYDQSAFNLVGDYDLFGNPGDQWHYYLASGMSAKMTSEPTVTGYGPFLSSSGGGGYTGFTIPSSQHSSSGANQIKGYVLVQSVLQWPNLNSNSETFADVQVYKSMSLLDTFPIGDYEVLISFLGAQYPNAPFTGNDDIIAVFARNIISYMNTSQQSLMPE